MAEVRELVKEVKDNPDVESFRDYCRKIREKSTLNDRILLVKVPQMDMDIFEPDVARNRGYQVYPPVGLQSLAQALDGTGLKVRILDMNYELLRNVNLGEFDHKNWISLLEEKLERHDPSIVGVSCMFEVSEEQNFKEVLRYLREEGERLLIIGGTNVTYKEREFLESGLCDIVFKRESENKVRYFVSEVFKIKDESPTPGIYFLHNDEIKTTGNGNDVVNHTGNLIAQHQILPVEMYNRVGTLGPMQRMAGEDKPFATPLITRGCRFKCSFCSVRSFNGPGVRNREVDDVLDELRFLYESKGIRHFEFLDDDLGGGDRSYILAVLNGIRDSGMDVTWSAQNGMIAKYLDEELLKAFEESGCVGFKVGVETGNKEMLHHVEKPGTLETFRAFAQRMRNHPKLIVPHNYIIGFPDETFRYMMDTYWFSGEIQTDWCAFSTYQPIADKKRAGEKADSNFIPVKSKRRMDLVSSEGVLTGPDIFYLPLDEIPSRRQVEQIWNSFNMARNFIHNVNLKPNGQPDKFIRYVTALQENYPLNPYMPFFLSLTYLSVGNTRQAEKYLERARRNLESGTGQEIFNKFGLNEVLCNFPTESGQARDALDHLMSKHSWYEEPETFSAERYIRGINN